jgi:hypothetical protein
MVVKESRILSAIAKETQTWTEPIIKRQMLPVDVVLVHPAANRIEEGAALLAVFTMGLSDEEWRTPVSYSDGAGGCDRAPRCQRLPH